MPAPHCPSAATRPEQGARATPGPARAGPPLRSESAWLTPPNKHRRTFVYTQLNHVATQIPQINKCPPELPWPREPRTTYHRPRPVAPQPPTAPSGRSSTLTPVRDAPPCLMPRRMQPRVLSWLGLGCALGAHPPCTRGAPARTPDSHQLLPRAAPGRLPAGRRASVRARGIHALRRGRHARPAARGAAHIRLRCARPLRPCACAAKRPQRGAQPSSRLARCCACPWS